MLSTQEHYFKTIQREFILFLLQQEGGIYPLVDYYINQNFKESIKEFLKKQIPVTKPQNLLKIGFNFYNTKEGYTYWKRNSRAWEWKVKNSVPIQEAIQLKRNQK